jgi:glycosyltransferase involved in cell wall biosynthesis
VVESGVDLDRFTPRPETPGQRLLFIGSFRHFPNIAAFCFFTERVWPLVRAHSAWTADTAEAFAAGIATLIADPERRAQIARAALLHAKRNSGWRAIGEKQRELLRGTR